MRPRLSLPKALGWLCLLVVLLAPSLARAQTATITWDGVNPVRKVPLNRHAAQPYWVSRADCLDNDTFTFNISVAGTGDLGTLEVWASTGTDCSVADNRYNSAITPICYPVFYAVPVVGANPVTIRVQDVVDSTKVPAISSVGHGTANACNNATTSASITVNLYFVLVQSGTTSNNFSGAAPKYPFTYDLAGPPPPASVSAGIGENSLFVHWAVSGNADILGYSIYCANQESVPPGLIGAAGAAGAGGIQGAGGTGGGAGESAAGTDTGGTGTGGTGTAGTAGQLTINQNCFSSVLFANQLPPATMAPCGTGNGSTQSEGQAKGLQNDQSYAVGVAAFDQVGNVGVLSNLACATPQLVDDFFDRYRAAGGKAGGGFCTIQRYASPWAALLLAGATVAYALRRRRPGH
jgi:hypothetical protein